MLRQAWTVWIFFVCVFNFLPPAHRGLRPGGMKLKTPNSLREGGKWNRGDPYNGAHVGTFVTLSLFWKAKDLQNINELALTHGFYRPEQ